MIKESPNKQKIPFCTYKLIKKVIIDSFGMILENGHSYALLVER